ncbi:MAG: GIY-YIG nuclease family protein [Alcanivoracaceae bacterium]
MNALKYTGAKPTAPGARVAATWFLYIVRSHDASLYTGITTDVARRLQEHAGAGSKPGARYLRARKQLSLVYSVALGDRSLASKAEWRVKRLSKAAKETLVKQAPDAASLLAQLALDQNA